MTGWARHPLVYTLAVTNHGPSAATDVVVTDLVSPVLTVSGVTPTFDPHTETTGLALVGRF